MMYFLKQSTNTSNILVKVRKAPPKPPKAVIVLFIVFLYTFGIDYGFRKFINKKILTVTIAVQVFMTILVLAILLSTVYRAQSNESYVYFNAFIYIIHCAIVYMTKYNVCDLMVDIHSLIDNIKVRVVNKVAIIIYVYMIITFFKFVLCVLSCMVENEECNSLSTPAFVYCIPATAMDSLTIIQILINYYIYVSVTYIKRSLNKLDIKVLQANYMTIANSWDRIKPMHAKLVLAEIVTLGPRLLTIMLYIATYIKNDMYGMFMVSSLSLFLSMTLLQLCGPAIVVEMIKTEVEAVKLEIHKQLFLDADKEKNDERNHLLRYMSAKPLQHDIWNIIPTDLKLPTSVISERYNIVVNYCDKIRPLNSAFVVMELLAFAPILMGMSWQALAIASYN